MPRFRRNVVDEPRALLVAALAAIAAGFVAPELTTSSAANAVLFGLGVGAATWAAASAPWWAVVAAAAIAAATAENLIAFSFGLAATALGIWIGVRRRNLPEARAIAAGVAFNVLAYSQLELFLGASAIVGAVVALVVAVIGLRRRPSAVRRVAYSAAGGVAVVLILAVIGFGVSVASARSNLSASKRQAEEAIAALNRGDFDTAEAKFAASERAMRRAESQLGKPWAAPAAFVPVLSQHREALSRLTEAGVDASNTVTSALDDIDPDTVRVVNGRVDLAAVGRLEEPFANIDEALETLSVAVDDARSPWLVAPVTDALDELDLKIADNAPKLDNAISAVQLAPDMLGGNGVRRYLVLFTTPSEARGLGGFAGNYAELTLDEGRITMSAFGRVQDLELTAVANAARVSGPDAFLDHYGRFGYDNGGRGGATIASWRNITISPNFPHVAQVATELYPQSGGRPVDGVVVVDPYVLQALLRYTGPIQLSTVDKTLNVRNAADYILTEQYFEPDREQRIDALEEAAELTIDRLLAGSLPDPTDLAHDLGPFATERRLLMWTKHADEQDLLDRVGLLGAIPAHDGADGYSVAVTNGSGNKIDAFLERRIGYESTTDADDGTTASLRVELTNTAPSTGLPDYLIGNLVGLPRGTSRLFVEFYSPLDLDGVTLNGKPTGLAHSEAAGWNVYSTFVNIAAGATAAFELELHGRLERPDEMVTWEQPLVFPAEVIEGN